MHTRMYECSLGKTTRDTSYLFSVYISMLAPELSQPHAEFAQPARGVISRP